MKRQTIIGLLILGGLCAMATSGWAQNVEKESKPTRIIWTKRPNRHTGLFTTRNRFVAPGVSINGAAFYYFGDVDNVGVAFNGGFNRHNVGGGLTLSYQLPISNHCNVRVGLQGGKLGGNSAEKLAAIGRSDYRKFSSVVMQPSAGVQYYPFSGAGFYLYGGLGLAVSYITNFLFVAGDNTTRSGAGAICVLPMVHLGLGYTWMLSTSWSLGVECLVNVGLCDTYYSNLDAWPLAASQSREGIATGLGKKNDWNDGFFQFGITLIYQWRNCESCGILNNYAGIRPRRKR